MRCTTCHTEVTAPGARWCGRCGARLERHGDDQPSDRGRRMPGWARRTAPASVVAGVVVGAMIVAASTTWSPEPDPSPVFPPAGARPGPGDDVGVPPGAVQFPSQVRPEGGLADRRVPEATWTRELPEPVTDVALGDEVVAAAVGTSVHAFARSDGEPLWTRDTVDRATRSVLVVDATLVLEVAGGGVAVLDLATGEPRWEDHGDWAGLAAADGRLLLAGSDRIESRDTSSGEVAWRRREAGHLASGRIGDVAVVTTSGGVHGLDVATGASRWRRDLAARRGAHQSERWAVVPQQAGLRVLEVATGRIRATLRVPDDLGDRVRGQARVSVDERVVASLGSHVVATDLDGRPAWQATPGGRVSLLDVDGTVAVTAGGAGIRLLDPVTGAETARHTPSAWFTALDLDQHDVAVASHTPTRGLLQLHSLP